MLEKINAAMQSLKTLNKALTNFGLVAKITTQAGPKTRKAKTKTAKVKTKPASAKTGKAGRPAKKGKAKKGDLEF